MSGQTTGWVLRNGPDDRAMRAVLITIADAANRDGENAHPGVPAMIEGSGYSRTAVVRALRQLEAEGWIEVTERGGRGPRSATVYRVVTERPRVPGWDPSETAKGANQHTEGCQPAPPRVPTSDRAPLTATVTTNGTTNAGPPPSAPATSAVARRDPLFDAVAAECGIDPSEITPSARGAMNHALAELRAIDADPDDVARRAAVYRSRFPNVVLTPTALAKHWPSCAQPVRPPASPARPAVSDDSLAAGARWLERQRLERQRIGS